MKVLVLSARGFHLGYVGCYGNEWIATPALDRMAAEGVVFDQHFAESPDSAVASVAWRAGRYSFPWPEWKGDAPQQEEQRNLFTLNKHGVRTILISTNAASTGPTPDSGWDHIYEPEVEAEAADKLEQTLAATLELLDELAREEQWLVKVDLDVLLPPRDVPAEFREAYFEEEGEESATASQPDPESEDSPETIEPDISDAQREFAGAVTYMDAGLERLLGELEERPWSRDLIVIITSDAGQVIDEERRGSSKETRLHEELVHIPLIVRFGDRRAGGRRISALTQPVDLLPTIFDLFGLPVPESQGRSLLPLMQGTAGSVRDYACVGLQSGQTIEWTLRSPHWALLLPMRPPGHGSKLDPELYVKPDDRWEVNNVWHHHVVLADRLEKTLHGFVAATRGAGPFQPPSLPDLDEIEKPDPDKGEPNHEYGATGG
jgi:arylsulfatase A-like enzyme